MPSVTGAIIAGGLSAAGGIASAAIGSSAAKSAASTQAAAARNAAAAQLAMFNKTSKLLQPYVGAGNLALGQLQGLTGTGKGGNPLTATLTAPFQPTMQQLEQTPGYQFALHQGELATQNSFAGQGLGQSGAAMKGAAQFAEGLASTTYQQQFQNYLSQNQQIYNMLGGLAGQGENAAAKVGNMGLQSQSQANALLTSGAAASAAGQVGAANALTGGIGSAIGGISQAALLTSLANSGMFGNQLGVGANDFGGANFGNDNA